MINIAEQAVQQYNEMMKSTMEHHELIMSSYEQMHSFRSQPGFITRMEQADESERNEKQSRIAAIEASKTSSDAYIASLN